MLIEKNMYHNSLNKSPLCLEQPTTQILSQGNCCNFRIFCILCRSANWFRIDSPQWSSNVQFIHRRETTRKSSVTAVTSGSSASSADPQTDSGLIHPSDHQQMRFSFSTDEENNLNDEWWMMLQYMSQIII